MSTTTTTPAADRIPDAMPVPAQERPERTMRLLLRALKDSVGSPRFWGTAWLTVTTAALIAVVPVALGIDDALAHHPGASRLLDQALDADLARTRPDLVVSTSGASVFLALAWAFLAGGILCHVGGPRPRFAAVLADSGRLLLRNLRVLAIFAVLVLLLTWGCEALNAWLWEDALYDTDPGAMLFGTRWLSVETFAEAVRYVEGFAVLLLVFTAKLAAAWLAATDRRSASWAWLRSLWLVACHPLRMGFAVAALAVLWLGISHLIGMATAWLLEVRGLPWAGLATGQLGVVWTQIVLVAAFVLARDLWLELRPAAVSAARVPAD